MDTTIVLNWFRVVLPMLIPEGHPFLVNDPEDLTEEAMLALGVDALAEVCMVWPQPLSPNIARAFVCFVDAMDCLARGQEPYVELLGLYYAVRNHLDVTTEGDVHSGALAQLDQLVDDLPGPAPVPLGGLYSMTPADRCDPQRAPVTPVAQPEEAPPTPSTTRKVRKPRTPIEAFHAVFFPLWEAWATLYMIENPYRRDYRHALQGVWYGEGTSLSAKADIPLPPQFYGDDTDPSQVGSLAWLVQVDQEAFDQQVGQDLKRSAQSTPQPHTDEVRPWAANWPRPSAT